MDHFDDQYLGDATEPLGLPFDEETNFFHPEEVHDGEDFQAAQQQEESIYTDDPVRVYLHQTVTLMVRSRRQDTGRQNDPFIPLLRLQDGTRSLHFGVRAVGQLPGRHANLYPPSLQEAPIPIIASKRLNVKSEFARLLLGCQLCEKVACKYINSFVVPLFLPKYYLCS